MLIPLISLEEGMRILKNYGMDFSIWEDKTLYTKELKAEIRDWRFFPGDTDFVVTVYRKDPWCDVMIDRFNIKRPPWSLSL